MAEPVTPPAPQPDEAPIPDKFKNQDGTLNAQALLKSYNAIEPEWTRLKQKGDSSGTPAAPETPADASDDGLTLSDPVDTTNLLTQEVILKKAGLKPADIAKQMQEHGDLTPAQYSAFGRAGLAKDLAHQFVRGIAATAKLEHMEKTAALQSAHQIAGGSEQFQVVWNWAKNGGVDAADRARFDKMVKSDPANYAHVTRLLVAAYAESNGDKAELVKGDGFTAGGAQPAKDAAEYSKLLKLHAKGDKNATARIMATPADAIARGFK